jgi:DNA-binding XRE family transcriptional regulator
MDNHYHLLVETPEGNLSAGMRDLNGLYTQFFNKQNKTVGHVFQGRYHTFLIEKDGYYLNVARYIVLNPVRAQLVDHPRDWPWSSYQDMLAIKQRYRFFQPKRLLDFFHQNQKIARKAFKSFVDETILDTSPFGEIHEGTILGSPQFVSEVYGYREFAHDSREIPVPQRLIGRPILSQLFDKQDDIFKRNELIRFARSRCGYSVTAIAKQLGIHRTTVSRILNESSKRYK